MADKYYLKECRKAAGYKATEFAEKIGMPYKTYEKYEQGVRDITLGKAMFFASELGCTLNDLAYGPSVENNG